MLPTIRPVLRFAPSPNGELHLGHALSALTGWAMAQTLGGRFLLRIEDIDTARTRPEFVAGIFRDLAWLGLRWEEPVLFQSTRFSAYAQAARKLSDLGVLYPCFATRSEIDAASDPARRDPDGAPLYPGLWRDRSLADITARKEAREPFALRLHMDAALALARTRLAGAPLTFIEQAADGSRREVEADPARWGDAVLIRKDTPASYHLAVVVDDAFQGITHVTRGQDLFAATDIHRLLQVLLDIDPPVYTHHALVTDDSGRKLAKSARDTSLAALRAEGATPDDIRRSLRLA